MGKIFRKGGMSGTLQRHTIDHCVRCRGRLRWTTKQVLMLTDANGAVLCYAQFRTNATTLAANFLKDLGWQAD